MEFRVETVNLLLHGTVLHYCIDYLNDLKIVIIFYESLDLSFFCKVNLGKFQNSSLESLHALEIELFYIQCTI